jgi:beta-glucanase (GH16 family)
MKFYKILTSLFFVYFLFIGCKKAGADSVAELLPTNLSISANVSVDGTGTVVFTATATNAVSYAFEFGNGQVRTVPSGVTTYQYTTIGNNTYTVTVTATGSSGAIITKSAQIQVDVKAPGNVLLWADEFNVAGTPDPTKWKYDIGTGSGGWGNQELQYYTNRADNSIVSNGTLKITAKRENHMGMGFTSARLLTQDKFAFKYGKIEVKAKLPAGVGTWPAVWMLGNNIKSVGWPACGEIDIVEHRGSELNKIFGTLHYPGRSGGNANGSTRLISNATTEFHIYTVEWYADAIRFYVDNQLFHSVANSPSLPFNHDFFLLANLAIGGTFAGAVDPNFNSATLEIDYIRIYK